MPNPATTCLLPPSASLRLWGHTEITATFHDEDPSSVQFRLECELDEGGVSWGSAKWDRTEERIAEADCRLTLNPYEDRDIWDTLGAELAKALRTDAGKAWLAQFVEGS